MHSSSRRSFQVLTLHILFYVLNHKPGVFGIITKLLENAREWCRFYADILNKFQVFQVSNLESYTVYCTVYFYQILSVFCQCLNYVY